MPPTTGPASRSKENGNDRTIVRVRAFNDLQLLHACRAPVECRQRVQSPRGAQCYWARRIFRILTAGVRRCPSAGAA